MFQDLLKFSPFGPSKSQSLWRLNSFWINLNLIFPRIPAKFGGSIWLSSFAYDHIAKTSLQIENGHQEMAKAHMAFNQES